MRTEAIHSLVYANASVSVPVVLELAWRWNGIFFLVAISSTKSRSLFCTAGQTLRTGQRPHLVSPCFFLSIIGVEVSWHTSVMMARSGCSLYAIISAHLSPISSCTLFTKCMQISSFFACSFNNLATCAIINPPTLLSKALPTK